MTAIDRVRSRPRRFWGDARFLLGVLLIVVSVVGVWLVVTSARQTAPVLAASRTIVPGQTLLADDLRTVDVALGQVGGSYVSPGALQEGAVATRTIPEGELLPADAVGEAADARVTRVVVDTAAEVPSSLEEGTRVELWSAPVLEGDAHGPPRILVADATVAAVLREDAVMGAGGVSLELVIPRADVAATLTALSDGSRLSVVPSVGEGR